MNRADVIRLAREAGIDAESDTLCRHEGWVEPLEHFAALVEADVRKEIAGHLRRAGAKLPIDVQSTIESAMTTGLSIALALVEAKGC